MSDQVKIVLQEGTIEKLELGPGDMLLVKLRAPVSLSGIERCVEALRAAMPPGGRFLVVEDDQAEFVKVAVTDDAVEAG